MTNAEIIAQAIRPILNGGGTYEDRDDFIDVVAQTAISALTEAGLAIVPVERLEGEPLSYKNAKTVIQMSEQLANTDALAEALKEIMEWINNWSPVFVQDEEWPDTNDKITTALTDYQEGK